LVDLLELYDDAPPFFFRPAHCIAWRFMALLICMVGVAFLTMLERRVLGSIHICREPNKVGFFSHLEMLLGYFVGRSIFL